MTTIQISVQDDLIHFLGLEKIKKIMEDELFYQRFRLMESEIQSAMTNAKNVEWDKEFEKVREEAYKEYISKNKQ
ncbi:MAG: hypothetical protein A2275_13435 [Bacteroidetes bacterium RIFOXYA12_FULL_35_11]|nr:MAG: hypothetical protein A2X01_20380 [Bacteroidetes bacterium GWF2_35_48]OFY81670.1 MAG: hypothetical protein A2275_13435 [Bacteroidetes bacterium RIFOXYA12_FULL_35_11]OFY96373.1 MAG: hypothetical protein A2309_01935 [Bacteroidetes bacterium RIFOXYB2_FULL_35_7]OFZ04956.1 MAG: hypothetical protein A2491_17360 [Bacteroidetes bacterium RIFOXYC12_FULL_35_7]HBX50244.1 hypothetical protein [Bacteroidales bacterium]